MTTLRDYDDQVPRPPRTRGLKHGPARRPTTSLPRLTVRLILIILVKGHTPTGPSSLPSSFLPFLPSFHLLPPTSEAHARNSLPHGSYSPTGPSAIPRRFPQPLSTSVTLVQCIGPNETRGRKRVRAQACIVRGVAWRRERRQAVEEVEEGRQWKRWRRGRREGRLSCAPQRDINSETTSHIRPMSPSHDLHDVNVWWTVLWGAPTPAASVPADRAPSQTHK